MPQSKSLLEKAKESARRARANAHRKLMWGGDGEEVDKVEFDDFEPEFEQSGGVEDAVARAVQRAQEAEDAVGDFEIEDEDWADLEDQEGGFKNFELLKAKVADRKSVLVSKFGVDGVPSDKAIMNSLRSYKAVVNGHLLGPKRYFHGSPIAAARKVVGILNKDVHYTKKNNKGVVPTDKPAEMPSVGINNALDIKLIEVTKGVHKGKHGADKYTYEYFGWRDNVKAKGPKDAGKIKVGSDGKNFKEVQKGDRVVRVFWENIAIPKRGKKTAKDALVAKQDAASKRAGALAKARSKPRKNKKVVTVASVIGDEQIAETLRDARKAKAAARKVPKRPPTEWQTFRSKRIKELKDQGMTPVERRKQISRQWKETKARRVPLPVEAAGNFPEHLKQDF